MYSRVTRDTVVVARDAADEEQRGEDHAGLDGDGEVGEHRQRERHHPDRRGRSSPASRARGSRAIRPCCRRRPSGSRRAPPSGHRRGQRRGEQQDREQRQRVNHAGDRRPARRSGCWSPCGRWRRWPAGRRPAATRCWRRPARTARRSELWRVAGHPVGDDRRQQRLDRAEHRDRQRRREQRQDQVGAEVRELELAAGRPGCRRSACRSSRAGAAARRPRPVPATSATM